MKTHPILIILAIFSIVFLTNCQQEPLDSTDLASQSELSKKDFTDPGILEVESAGKHIGVANAKGSKGGMGGMGNGGNGEGDTVQYIITFTGDVTGTKTITRPKPKKNDDIILMASYSEGGEFTISGVDNLEPTVDDYSWDCLPLGPHTVGSMEIAHTVGKKSKTNKCWVRFHIVGKDGIDYWVYFVGWFGNTSLTSEGDEYTWLPNGTTYITFEAWRTSPLEPEGESCHLPRQEFGSFTELTIPSYLSEEMWRLCEVSCQWFIGISVYGLSV